MWKFSFSVQKSIARNLNCQRFLYAHFSIQLTSQTFFLTTAYTKTTSVFIIKTAVWFQNMMKYRCWVIFLRKIGEKSKLFAMTMQINCPTNIKIGLTNMLQKIPNLATLSTLKLHTRIPTSISIISKDVSPWITMNNPIWIDHRNDIKSKLRQQW